MGLPGTPTNSPPSFAPPREEHPHKITPGWQIGHFNGVCPDKLYFFASADEVFVLAGIPELVDLLRSQGKHIFLVSGGFRQIIHPLAKSLNIPLSNVFANSILFKVGNAKQEILKLSFPYMGTIDLPQGNGDYDGFDDSEFTCRSGGKPAAIRHIKVGLP